MKRGIPLMLWKKEYLRLILFLFVRDGYAEEIVQKVSSKQENFNMKLNEEIVQEEKDIFDYFYRKTNSCSAQC